MSAVMARMLMAKLTFILNTTFLCVQIVRSCPDACHCFQKEADESLVVNCTNSKLDNFPIFDSSIAENILVLNMDKNSLPQLNFSDLNVLPNLQYISCRYCKTSRVSFKDVNLPKLLQIDLSHNVLTDLDVDLVTLHSVTTLSLNNNYIKTISSNIFKAFPSLEHLYLAYNAIESVSMDMFLCENTTLLSPACQCCLKTVILQNNKISKIHPKPFERLSALEALDLSRNRLTQLPSDAFVGLEQLRHLDISNNYIDDIKEDLFSPVKNLKFLHLHHNQLQKIPADIPMLEWLDVSYNNIPTISEEMKSVIYPIEIVNFAHNPFICDCKLIWVKELFDQRKFMEKHIDLAPDEFVPKCEYPSMLAGLSWDTLTEDMMTCDDGGCLDCKKQTGPFRPEHLSVYRHTLSSNSVRVNWKLVGSKPLFPTVFIQYYLFGSQLHTMKYMELNIFQKEVVIKGLLPKSNYRFCVIPRLTSLDDGKTVMPLSHSHCVEVTTPEQEKTQPISLLWILLYYVLGMIGTVVFLIFALTGTAFVASFFSDLNKWTDKNGESFSGEESNHANHNEEISRSEEKPHKHCRLRRSSKPQSAKEKLQAWPFSDRIKGENIAKECLASEKVVQHTMPNKSSVKDENSVPSTSKSPCITHETGVDPSHIKKSRVTHQQSINYNRFILPTKVINKDTVIIDEPVSMQCQSTNCETDCTQRQEGNESVSAFTQHHVCHMKPENDAVHQFENMDDSQEQHLPCAVLPQQELLNIKRVKNDYHVMGQVSEQLPNHKTLDTCGKRESQVLGNANEILTTDITNDPQIDEEDSYNAMYLRLTGCSTNSEFSEQSDCDKQENQVLGNANEILTTDITNDPQIDEEDSYNAMYLRLTGCSTNSEFSDQSDNVTVGELNKLVLDNSSATSHGLSDADDDDSGEESFDAIYQRVNNQVVEIEALKKVADSPTNRTSESEDKETFGADHHRVGDDQTPGSDNHGSFVSDDNVVKENGNIEMSSDRLVESKVLEENSSSDILAVCDEKSAQVMSLDKGFSRDTEIVDTCDVSEIPQNSMQNTTQNIETSADESFQLDGENKLLIEHCAGADVPILMSSDKTEKPDVSQLEQKLDLNEYSPGDSFKTDDLDSTQEAVVSDGIMEGSCEANVEKDGKIHSVVMETHGDIAKIEPCSVEDTMKEQKYDNQATQHGEEQALMIERDSDCINERKVGKSEENQNVGEADDDAVSAEAAIDSEDKFGDSSLCHEEQADN